MSSGAFCLYSFPCYDGGWSDVYSRIPCFADKDPGHVIGGFKAAITNPNTSAEAKEHAAERLQELGEPDYTSSLPDPVQQELGTHQIAGYKATISSS